VTAIRRTGSDRLRASRSFRRYGTHGTGGMTHADPDDRPAAVFGGTVTLHAGGDRESSLLLPVIPPKAGA
jgi:hypothetical protein